MSQVVRPSREIPPGVNKICICIHTDPEPRASIHLSIHSKSGYYQIIHHTPGPTKSCVKIAHMRPVIYLQNRMQFLFLKLQVLVLLVYQSDEGVGLLPRSSKTRNASPPATTSTFKTPLHETGTLGAYRVCRIEKQKVKHKRAASSPETHDNENPSFTIIDIFTLLHLIFDQ